MAILGNIFRFLFAWLDGIIITIITAIYNLIIDLSNLILSSDNIVKALGQRIGLVLGIFMLFRIAITLINYLISPDKVSDSSKGGGKLIGNIILSLALLVTVNFVFNTAYKLQKQIVDSNIIGKIFFGNVKSTVDAQGNKVIGTNVSISYYLYSAFFTPNEDIAGFDACRNLWDLSITIKNSECDKKLIELLENNARDTIHNAREKMDMSLVYTNYDLVLATKGTNTSVFNYIPGLSTACGVIAILILINFCMDLAVRAVKMLFLQIIAPIPIISNMDPGKGKEIFQKWYKECISTYLGVFIRLIAINFAVFMISIVYGNFSDMFSKNALINVFIIIGCLMFAKQVPKLLESMFGIKSDGFVLNPMKRFQDQALFGKNITGLAAGATVGTIGALSGAGAGRIVTGTLGGLFSGKGFGETWKNQVGKNATMRTANLNGSTLGGRMYERFSNIIGSGGELADIERDKHAVQDELDRIDREIKIQEDAKAQIKGTAAYRNRQHQMQQQNAISSAANKMKERAISQVRNGEGTAGAQYQRALREVERLKHASFGRGTRFTYTDENGNTITRMFATEADAVAEAERLRQAAEHYVENNGWREYTTEVSTGAYADASMTSLQMKFDDAYDDVHGSIINHNAANYGQQLNSALGTAKGAITTLEVQGAADERRIADIDRTIADYNGQKQPYNDQMRDISRRESIANANKNAVGK